MKLINVIIQALIILGSAIFGYLLGKGYLFIVIMVGVIILEAIVIQVLVNSNVELMRVLNEQKNCSVKSSFLSKTSILMNILLLVQ